MKRTLIEEFRSSATGSVDISARRPFPHDAACNPMLLESGWALRAVPSHNGRRQIAYFFMPGDLIVPPEAGSGSVLEAVTDCRVAVLGRKPIYSRLMGNEGLLRDVVKYLREGEGLGDLLLFVLGQMPAIERLAWLILHLHGRTREVGRVRDGAMDFPLTQLDLAEALGLSLVHVNKSIARLRRDNILVWDRQHIYIKDLERLRAISDFNTASECEKAGR